MHENFVGRADVPALGNAKSYAARLFDYAGAGHDQIAWVVRRLRDDRQSRSATITTFQPLTDTSYIPCVSLLDFWLPDGAVELVVYAHSLDRDARATTRERLLSRAPRVLRRLVMNDTTDNDIHEDDHRRYRSAYARPGPVRTLPRRPRNVPPNPQTSRDHRRRCSGGDGSDDLAGSDRHLGPNGSTSRASDLPFGWWLIFGGVSVGVGMLAALIVDALFGGPSTRGRT